MNPNPCIAFDDEQRQFTILIGTQETISYDDVKKVSVLNEEAPFKGKSKPFSHQVLGGVTFYSMLGEPSLYVGLKIVLQDASVKAVYISDRKTTINTDIYRQDRALAEKMKTKLEKRMKAASSQPSF